MSRNLQRSIALQHQAFQVMPLGVSSNLRYWGEGKTLYVEKAKGAYLWDVDGNRYIDYRLAFGPVILGYAYDEVDQRVFEAIRSGVTVGFTRQVEVSAAEKMVALCPGVEMVRFVSSGTEATMHALRLARAFTGREKVIKFEGGYHGSLDYVLFSTYAPPSAYGSRQDPVKVPASSGIPAALQDLILTVPFNDPDLIADLLKRQGHEVAAVLTEPMLGNFGSVDPQPGFLAFLREQCDRYGVLLLFDEVKTGFRIAPGGAAEAYGVLPDLSTFAKAIGNGYPVAAYGGRREVMSLVGKGVSQGGTYSGNAIGVAAADATLGILTSQPVHPVIGQLGRQLQEGMRQIFSRANIQALISRHPAIFSISFGVDRVTDARDWGKSDLAFYQRFAEGLLQRGILVDEDPREPWCLCYSHTPADIENTLSVVADVIGVMK